MAIIIPLTREQITIVDDEDGDLVQFKWQAGFYANYAGGGKFLAVRGIHLPNGKRCKELLHRVILARKLGRPLLRNELTDHIHGLTLDNRRSELRLATHTQNQLNKGRQSRNASGYKGVFWDKGGHKWRATICINGKNKVLGFFPEAEEAYKAYCEAALKYHGEFANLG